MCLILPLFQISTTMLLVNLTFYNKIELMIEKKGYHGQYTCLTVKDLDVHIMNKYELNDTINKALANE